VKRPSESDYTSHVAYARALEEYCDTLAQPAPVQPEQEFVDQLLINECKSVSLNYQTALYELQRKPRTDNYLYYCIGQVRILANMLAMLVSHTETWQGKHGYPKHVLTSVEMIPDCRHYLEVGMHETFIEHMNHCLEGSTPPAAQPAPSQYGSPELQAMIVARAIEKDRAAQPAQEPVAYPEGDVVGPCICGSWPGGKCLKCPRIAPPATLKKNT